MQLFGEHNVLNALSAIMTCFQLGVDMKVVREGLAAFQGVTRRFDIRMKNDKVCYIDDYAHHPEEIKATETYKFFQKLKLYRKKLIPMKI